MAAYRWDRLGGGCPYLRRAMPALRELWRQLKRLELCLPRPGKEPPATS